MTGNTVLKNIYLNVSNIRIRVCSSFVLIIGDIELEYRQACIIRSFVGNRNCEFKLITPWRVKNRKSSIRSTKIIIEWLFITLPKNWKNLPNTKTLKSFEVLSFYYANFKHIIGNKNSLIQINYEKFNHVMSDKDDIQNSAEKPEYWWVMRT